MNRFFLGMSLGHDPHTVGIHNAGRIAKMLNIDYYVAPTDINIEQQLELILKYEPKYLGFSYRLSKEKAIPELLKMLQYMKENRLIKHERKICFAALPDTLDAIRDSGIAQYFHLSLMGQDKNIDSTTMRTLQFFDANDKNKIREIIELVHIENEPEKISILDQIAKDVVANDIYRNVKELPIPSEAAKKSYVKRMQESDIPMIRTHFGIPAENIEPTVNGIRVIANAHVVDEVSLGSSDLSQRYFGKPEYFVNYKNDGGVPYKDENDLAQLFQATRTGNFPSIKPYCHVDNMIPFADTCRKVGMLIGAHQAVPLFWFSELDGRGEYSVFQAIKEHIKLVKHLNRFDIPIEMNDPNQWSSRYAHDTVFVTDYALIASVMYTCNVQNMCFQLQFNKPMVTGDYGDLAKMNAACTLIDSIRPKQNHSNIIIETRAGIEHFSVEQNYAKYQLARSTLLQMILKPNIIHLVSFCEADHAAQPEDIIESSQIVRHAINLFRKNEQEIKEATNHPFIEQRKNYLISEAKYLLDKIARLDKFYKTEEIVASLSKPEVLFEAMEKFYMTAPGINCEKYKNTNVITKPGKYGVIDCYADWKSFIAMTEKERLERMEV